MKLRQYSMPRPNTSTSERMDAPVVVKPLTVSNRASTKWGMAPPSQKGMAPNTLMAAHASATVTKPVCAPKPPRLALCLPRAHRAAPAAAHRAMAHKKARAFLPSPSHRHRAMGGTRNTASTSRMRPMVAPITVSPFSKWAAPSGMMVLPRRVMHAISTPARSGTARRGTPTKRTAPSTRNSSASAPPPAMLCRVSTLPTWFCMART